MTKPSARNRALPSFSKIFDFVKNGVTNSDLFSWLAALNRLARFARLRPLPPIRFLRRHRFFFSFHVEIEKKKRMGGIKSNYFFNKSTIFFQRIKFYILKLIYVKKKKYNGSSFKKIFHKINLR